MELTIEQEIAIIKSIGRLNALIEILKSDNGISKDIKVLEGLISRPPTFLTDLPENED